MINHAISKISTRANNQMTMSQHQTLNEVGNQQIPQQRNQKKKKKNLTLKSILEYGAWVLGS